MKLSKLFTGLALMGIGSHASAVDLVSLSQFPDWFQKSMVREKTVETSSQLALARFNIDTLVVGSYELVEHDEGFWYYLIDLGTGSPAECYVFTDFDGTATTLNSIIDLGLKGAEQANNKSLTGRFNYAVDSGMIGDTPYLIQDTLYHLGEGDDKVAGILKAKAAQTNDSLQVCLHNEMGYRDTFEQVFASFVGAFEQAESDPEFFESVFKISLNGMPLGYGREKYVKDQEGDIHTVTDSAFIMPVDASSISSTDSVSVSWSRPDGSLINGTDYSIENGQLTSEFAIEFIDDKWHVNGQLQGKKVELDLAHTEWLMSAYGNYVASVDLLNSEDDSTTFNMWTSEADPTSVLKVTMKKLTESDANIQIDMGPIVLKYLSQNNGVFEQGSMSLGPAKMDLEMVYTKGQPVQ